MIKVIKGLPTTLPPSMPMVIITKDDYQEIINPLVKRVVTAFGKVNYKFESNTPLKNYTTGAWIEDALLGMRYFTKWRKIAIVSEKKE